MCVSNKEEYPPTEESVVIKISDQFLFIRTAMSVFDVKAQLRLCKLEPGTIFIFQVVFIFEIVLNFLWYIHLPCNISSPYMIQKLPNMSFEKFVTYIRTYKGTPIARYLRQPSLKITSPIIPPPPNCRKLHYIHSYHPPPPPQENLFFH